MSVKPEAVIYTDGSCLGNPGPGGWASIVIVGGTTQEMSGGDPSTTNNRMELLGVINGLKSLRGPHIEMCIRDRYCGIDFMAITSDEEAVAAAKSIGVELPETAEKTWGNALYECFDQKVEEKLIQPTFITMHPVDVSPLAKRSPKDPRLTERFELFICHSEMGNAFSELNDPIDQRERFQKQVELRDKGDDEAGMRCV